MYYFYSTCFMVIIVLIHIKYSKSVDSGSLMEEQTEFSNEDIDSEERVGIQANFRPKHKYKFETDQDDLSKRSSEGIDEIQNNNPTQCAIMYKNNEPVGILQPYEDSFRFLPINGEATLVELNPLPIKKKSILDLIESSALDSEIDENKSDRRVGFADERYPAILAKFKINNRIATSRRQMLKRATEVPNTIDKQLINLKSTMAKVRSEDSVLVEEELKSILDDMGLIDDYSNREEKREISENEREVKEDENLETGTNKINLVKENQRDSRNKRESANNFSSRTSANTEDVKLVISTEKIARGSRCITNRATADKTTTLTEEDSRHRRDNLNANSEFPEENALFVESSALSTETAGDLNTYEKRVEREIRDKIQKLKEEVKKEIEDLSKAKKFKTAEDSRRKKRDIIPTLLDEETKDIDPNFNENDDNNKEHIRRKRDLTVETEIEPVNFNVDNHQIKNHDAKNVSVIKLDESHNSSYHKIRQKRHTEDDEFHYKGDVGIGVKNEHFRGNSNHEIFVKDGEAIASQNVDDTNLNNMDESSFVFDPVVLDRRSCKMCKNSNCHCDKKGNCKCGSAKATESDNNFKKNSPKQFYKRSSDMDFNLPIENELVELKDFDTLKNRKDYVKVREPRKSKENFQFSDGEYFIDQHPSIFKLTPVDNAEEYESLISSNKVADKSRSHLISFKDELLPHSRFRRRIQTENNAPLQLIDMSAEDLFGALPQSFEGELARYKRVKRARDRKDRKG